MKTFQILESASSKYSLHPQEDYLLASQRYPIFVVADGVTLELDSLGRYPVLSGVAEAARIFCEVIVQEAESQYEQFGQTDAEAVFRKANQAVGKYNLAQGRIKDKINFWDFDLLAATGAFVVIKNQIVYWASMCDAYAASFDEFGKNKFWSPECWPRLRRNLPDNWNTIAENERKKIIRRVYRNGVNEKGELIGYGVITGEENAVRYLSGGSFLINSGDIIAIFTDGFENYMKLPEFIDLFVSWPDDLEAKVRQFTSQKSQENPKEFGQERSLITVKL